MKSKFLPALAVLTGTIIGAGYLGIPYMVSKSGFIPGLICLIFVALFVMISQLYLGEISLRTKKNHQLTGYAEKYLGKTGKILMFFAMLFGIYSALAAYLLAEGESLSYILFGSEIHAFAFSMIFWIVMACFTFIGLKALKKYEKIVAVLVIATIILIIVTFSHRINIENLAYINSGNFFAPFGIIFFSFLSFSAMPEIRRVLSNQEKLFKKVIIFGISIAFFVYSIFTIILLGNFGRNVPEIATLALGRFFSVLAILTVFTAFFASSIAIRDMFRFDFKLGRLKGWILACFIPLALFIIIYLFKISSFVQILSVSGIVSGGLTGILILLMSKQAKLYGKRKPEYNMPINWWIIISMSIIFILAVIAEFVL